MNEMEKNSEYVEIFLAEALDDFTEINNLLTRLEKTPEDIKIIQALFRITHTLKGNSLGLGYAKIADLTHTLEDFFGFVRNRQIALQPDHFSVLFKAADVLGQLVNSVKTLKEVKYLGIKTKLDVIIKNQKLDLSSTDRIAEHSAELSSEESEVADVNQHLDETDVESTSVNFSDLVQVPVKKLDNLLNLVGELVIERDRIISASNLHSTSEYSHLNRISSDLQYSVMDIRLVQVGFLFNKFFRIVRDASVSENKKIKLKLEGADTEIDRNILQTMSDALIHLIRNAIGHGIERPEERIKIGKPQEGTLALSARSESETVFITIKDDGRGIDPDFIREQAVKKGILTRNDASAMTAKETINLIFAPGFSTMDEVTSIAGRGVGMDVVKKSVESMGGTVEVESIVGEGTIFTLSLPASMAVKSALLCELDSQTYAIPLSHTESVISLPKSDLHKTSKGLLAVHLGRTIRIVFLADLFSNGPASSTFQRLQNEQKIHVVVVSFNGMQIGLVVDKLLQQKEIVERPLFKPFDSIAFLSGATILGNGSVCLSLNIPGVLNLLLPNYNSQTVNV